MNEWFKYEFGFVNIDSNSIYLTNSGNWSETKDLTEKNSGTRKGDLFQKWKIIIFFIGAGLILIAFFLGNLITENISLLLLIGLPISGILLYNYLKTELGSQFLIPKSKLKGINIEEHQITIHFENGEGKVDVEILKNVEAKGIISMTDLTDKWCIPVTKSE